MYMYVYWSLSLNDLDMTTIGSMSEPQICMLSWNIVAYPANKLGSHCISGIEWEYLELQGSYVTRPFII